MNISKKYSKTIIVDILKAYLIEGLSHRKIQKSILKMDAPARGGGFVAMNILHEFGINGEHKGILNKGHNSAKIQNYPECINDAIKFIESDGTYFSGFKSIKEEKKNSTALQNIKTPVNIDSQNNLPNKFSTKTLNKIKLNSVKIQIKPDKNQEVYEKEEETDFQDIINSKIISENSVILSDKPKTKPEQLQKNGSNYWKRNPEIAAETIALANYSCECQIDLVHKTFISKKTNKNFVEAHHLIPMSCQSSFDNSLDVHSNIIAMCPNCHRAIHNSIPELQKELLERLFNNRKQQLLKQGIEISFDELINLYY